MNSICIQFTTLEILMLIFGLIMTKAPLESLLFFVFCFVANGKLQKNEKAFVPGCMRFVYLSEYALLKLLHAFFKSRRQSFSPSAFPTS